MGIGHVGHGDQEVVGEIDEIHPALPRAYCIRIAGAAARSGWAVFVNMIN
jgi:hypothetical protein